MQDYKVSLKFRRKKDPEPNRGFILLFHLSQHLSFEGILEDGIEPDFKHFTLDEIKANPDYQGADFISVDIDTSAYTLKPERFNVSWPKYLIKEVDQYTTQHPDTRSSFLAKAAKKYIEQNP